MTTKQKAEKLYKRVNYGDIRQITSSLPKTGLTLCDKYLRIFVPLLALQVLWKPRFHKAIITLAVSEDSAI